MLPPFGSRPMIDRPVIDLPQPDSPTRPRVSPGFDAQVDVADGLDDRAGQLDVRREVLDLKDWGHGAVTSRSRVAARFSAGLAAAQPHVEGVAQRVADEVAGHDGETMQAPTG